jgi:hypothetical protein
MELKLRVILLVISLIIIIPALVFTIIIGLRFNKTPDAYNKNENEPIDRYFSWILAFLYIGFLILCGAVFMFIKEKTSKAQLISSVPANASRTFVSGNVAK